MKAVLVEKPGALKITDLPKPEITSPDQVLIRVLCGGICGSDVGIYKGTNSLASYPRIIGHEFGGRVEAVGGAVTAVKPGDYVAVDPVITCGHCYACTHGRHNVCSTLQVMGVHAQGGFSEYALVTEDAVYKVDVTKIAKELLCFVEPYSIGAEVNNRAYVTEGDKVLVMGSGPIGVAVMQVAKTRGAQVLMTDLVDSRLDRAADMGADRVLNTGEGDLRQAVMDFTGGEGMPVVVDTVCQPWSLEQAVSLTCPAGRVVVLSTGSEPAAVVPADVTKKELDILGSRLSNHCFPEVITLLEQGKLSPEKMQTSVYHYTQAQEAMERVMNHPETECKVILRFDDPEAGQ